jgi:hypothetical protein
MNGLSWMCVAIDRRFSFASLLGNINFISISLTSGLLLNYKSMPIYVAWVKEITFLTNSYRILMINEFANYYYTICSSNNNNSSSSIDNNNHHHGSSSSLFRLVQSFLEMIY